MGVCNSPNIFQEKISELFEGFDTVRTFLDNVIFITSKYFTDHLKALEKVLQKLAELGLKLNAENSFFKRM